MSLNENGEEFENEEVSPEEGGSPSVEESIAAAAAELESDEEPKEQPSDDGGEGAQAGESEPEKPGRKRGPDGRFAKKEESEASSGEVGEASEPTPDPTPEPEKGPSLEPPAQWEVAQKEAFFKLPAAAQQESLKFWKNMEGHWTRRLQGVSQQAKHVEGVTTVLEQYAPAWRGHGVTDTQAITELCQTHKNLMSDPAGEVLNIMAKNGLTLDHLEQRAQNPGTPNAAPQAQNSLTAEDVRRILLEDRQAQLQQTATQAAISEVRSLQNERSSEGKYVYPELHDDSYLKRVQPLVEGFRKTQPGLSYGDAFRKVVDFTRIQEGKAPSSPTPISPRLSPQQELQKAKAASGSVRGRSGSLPPKMKARSGLSIEESIAQAEAELRAANSSY